MAQPRDLAPAGTRSSRPGPGVLALVWVIGTSAAVGRNGFATASETMASAVLAGFGVLCTWMCGLRFNRTHLRAWAVSGGGLVAVGFWALRYGFVYPVAVVGIGTVLAFGVMVRWSLVPGWPQRVTAVAGLAMAPLLAAMLGWYRDPAPRAFAALAGLTVVLLEVYSRVPAVARASDRAVVALGSGLSRVITTTVATLTFVLVILPITLVSRLFGYSPLEPGWTSTSSAWSVVDQRRVRTPGGEPVGASSTAMLELPLAPAMRRRARLRLIVPLVAVASLLLVVDGGSLELPPWRTSARTEADAPGTFTRAFEKDRAFDDAPWARDLRLDLLDAWSNLSFNAALGGWVLRDLSSKYINIHHGERATTPPEPGLGEPVVVWFLGGSAAFGAGQRDAHTIPSELVTRAGADRIPLEVHNLAVPATVNWQSAVLLIARLKWEDPPDLIVVYDGANDLALQDVLAAQGRGRSDEPASLVDAQLDSVLRERAEAKGTADGVLPSSASTIADEPTSPEEAGRLVFNRYRRGVEVIQRSGAEASVPVSIFWQPELRTKTPVSAADRAVMAEVNLDPKDLGSGQAYSAAARAGLGALGVVDLTSVFDGEDEALYWDTVHTNERGARLVADAIYERLAPTLSALHRGPG